MLLASVVPGCFASAEPESVAVQRAPVIYDADDRTEVFAERGARLRDAASTGTAAIVLRSALTIRADSAVALAAPSAQETFDLCPDEPFASQPSAALCTAVLVAPDVVLTAGHCLAWMSCARLALVFGFAQENAGQLRVLNANDVYECADVLSMEVSPYGSAPERDYAFLRLRRKVDSPYHPVELAPDTEIAAGMPLVLIGHGAGLPTKIARNGSVTDARGASADFYFAELDNFVGGSGSGVFDARARLIGLATSGEQDFTAKDEDCVRAIHAPRGAAAGEKVAYLAPLLEAFCTESTAAPELCERPAPALRCQASAIGRRGAHDATLGSTCAWTALSVVVFTRLRRTPRRRQLQCAARRWRERRRLRSRRRSGRPGLSRGSASRWLRAHGAAAR